MTIHSIIILCEVILLIRFICLIKRKISIKTIVISLFIFSFLCCCNYNITYFPLFYPQEIIETSSLFILYGFNSLFYFAIFSFFITCFLSYRNDIALGNAICYAFILNSLLLISNGLAFIVTSLFGFLTISNEVILLLSKLILFALIELFGHFFAKQDYKKINIFNIVIFFGCITFLILFDAYFMNNLSAIYFYSLIVCMILFFFLLYRLFISYQLQWKELTNSKLLIQEIELQKQNYQLNNDIINETRRMKHDQKHHLLLLKEYLDKNNLAALKRELDKSLDTFNHLPKLMTNNTSIDSIITMYLSKIEERHIQLHYQNDVTKDIIDKLDLYVLFGNLLDNAIDNCKSEGIKKIFIACSEDDSHYRIEIKNTVIMNKPININKTSKKEGYHGYGISSIECIVKKYNGKIEYHQQGQFFHVCVRFNKEN
ncbi:sensor histidine kinase [Tannockella kyphosi]|uniref:sensor histidine kinase n=1 Tax=Tannockella kyphosi TaxID=2899121 RepID=UPI0020123DE1|nr:GHKL domain-containing protein [Tannockella kyphosi]